nr:unnamed protein product [Callosobruchus chinensis]
MINPVSSDKFNRIFTGEYNIRFKSPKTDTCSTCDSLKVSLSDAEKAKNEEDIRSIKLQRELHHRKAEAGQDAIKQACAEATANPDIYAITFDLPTPMLSTGPTFYKKKVFCYNLGIHCLYPSQGYFYMWDESTASRGADEVGMWLHLLAKGVFQEIIHIFPQVGHTMLPCDRDFAQVEKHVTHHCQYIYSPDQWLEVLSISQKKNPFVVVRMQQEDFLKISEMKNSFRIPRGPDNACSISKAVRMMFTTENMDEIRYGENIQKKNKPGFMGRNKHERRVKKYGQGDRTQIQRIKKKLGRFQTVFSEGQEAQLVQYLKTMEARSFGLTPYDLRHLAFRLAEMNGIKHSFSQEKKVAGKDWLIHFLKRYRDLSLRKPESTSAARAMGFNKVAVSKFFLLLGEVMEKFKFTPDKIYNCDETGITIVAKKQSKIISFKGRRQVGVLTSAERGNTITAEICFSASGHYLIPLLVYPRKRMNPELSNEAQISIHAECYPTGWMQSHIFFRWFKGFVEQTGSTPQNPVLLLLDGHVTHTKNLEVINYAKDHGVVLLCFPPHCTHKLQALDVAFMNALSTYYSKEINVWLWGHPGRVVSQFVIAELFGNAFIKAATMSTAINGFRKIGVWLFNPDVFSDDDFAPSETTGPKNRLCIFHQLICNRILMLEKKKYVNQTEKRALPTSSPPPLIKLSLNSKF